MIHFKVRAHGRVSRRHWCVGWWCLGRCDRTWRCRTRQELGEHGFLALAARGWRLDALGGAHDRVVQILAEWFGLRGAIVLVVNLHVAVERVRWLIFR